MTYYTPQHIIDKLHLAMPQGFVDVCSSAEANQRVKATLYYTDYARQLNTDDVQGGLGVFANPPYERGFLELFVPHFFKFVNKHNSPYVLLVNSSTSSKWYRTCMDTADWGVFCTGRIGFYDSTLGVENKKNRYDSTFFLGNIYHTSLDNFKELMVMGARVRLTT